METEAARMIGAGLAATALIGAGIGVGLIGSVWSSRYLESLLFEVSTLAWPALLAPVLLLSIAAVVAAWVPAMRAGRTAPAEALKSE